MGRKNLIFVITLTLLLGVCFIACGKVSNAEFKITFDVDGVDYSVISTQGEETLKMPDDPIKEGYVFDGWYWDKDVWERPFTAESLLEEKLTANMRVYVKWIDKEKYDKEYTVTFNTMGGSEILSQMVHYNHLIAEPNAPTKEGYLFAGWYKTPDFSTQWNFSTDLVYSDTTLYAKFIEQGYDSKKYTVSFNSNGGSRIDNVLDIKYDSIISSPIEPTKKGYKFVGWYKDNSFNEQWNFEIDRILQNTTLYAKWEQTGASLECIIGAEVTDDKLLLVVDNDVTAVALSGITTISKDSTWKLYRDILGTKEISTKYATNESGELDEGANIFYIVVSSLDGTITNTYSLNVYRRKLITINYYDVYGNKINNASTNIYNYNIIEQPVNYNPEGYTLQGWNMVDDDVITPIIFGDSGTRIEKENDVNLYANATANEYILNLVLDEETLFVGDTTRTINYDDNVILNNPSKFGYTFIGWYDGLNKVDLLNNTFIWKYPTDKTLTAKFSINKYSVILDKNIDNAGSIGTAGQYDYNSQVSITAKTNLGYDWIGWYNGDVLLTDNITYTFNVPATSVSYNARWKVNDKMTPYAFSSTESTCFIIDIKDKERTSYSIPEYVTKINDNVFIDCMNISTFDVAENNKNYSGNGNCLVELSTKKLLRGCNNSVIPTDGSINIIAPYAFYECKALTNITIPSSVTSIGECVFSGCSNLENITIPFVGNRAGVTCNDTCQYPFGYLFGDDSYDGGIATECSYHGRSVNDLTSVTYYIPTSLKFVTILGGYIPYHSLCLYYNKLTNLIIGSDVTGIGEQAFYLSDDLIYNEYDNACYFGNSENPYMVLIKTRDTSITSCVIHKNTRFVYNGAFAGCSGLASISVEEGNKNYHSANNCLIETLSKTLIVGCKNSVIPDDGSVICIQDNAFNGCSELTNIVIPDSVIGIGSSAFSGCDGLQYNEYDNACYLGNSENPYMALIKVKDTAITSCTINENTKIIYYNAFYGCTKLADISIPNSVTSIGRSAFYNCSSLTSVTIPNSVISIGIFAFYNCSGLTNISIGNNVKNIGKDAFACCSKLTNIEIPDSVTSIGDECFSVCSNLQKIDLGSGLAFIGIDIFDNCYNLTNITVDSGNGIYHSEGNCLIETATKTLLFGCKNSVIPIDGSVTCIGDYAFYNCQGLTSITIPNSVKSIGEAAFYGCHGLSVIEIGTGVTSIGNMAFSRSYGPNTITVDKKNKVYHSEGNCLIETSTKTLIVGCVNSVIPTDGSVTKIGDHAFSGYYNLRSITIPSNIISIGASAFSGCIGLTSIVISNGVTSIGASAFSGCSGLKKIEISNTVISIGSCAFNGCTSVVSFIVDSGNEIYHSEGNCLIETSSKTLAFGCKNSVIPTDGSVTSIGDYAFYNSGLTSIEIPDSVTSIGDCAFEWCPSLTSITFTGTKEEWNVIFKGDYWDNYTGTYTIHCTDGDISKS